MSRLSPSCSDSALSSASSPGPRMAVAPACASPNCAYREVLQACYCHHRQKSRRADDVGFRQSGRVIVALTVREIVAEQLAKKLA